MCIKTSIYKDPRLKAWPRGLCPLRCSFASLRMTLFVTIRAIRVFTFSKQQLNAAARPQCRPARLQYEQWPLETAIGNVVETDGTLV